MKIQTVSYKRTKNLGDYENEVLELNALVGEDGDPDEAIVQLRDRVNAQLSISETVAELKNQQIYLEEQSARLQAQIESATVRWNKIQQFMEKLGINLLAVLPQATADDIPF